MVCDLESVDNINRKAGIGGSQFVITTTAFMNKTDGLGQGGDFGEHTMYV